MERWFNAVERYMKNMRICDIALLKICVCAAGMLWGMSIPKRHKKAAAFILSGIFSVTYVLLMVPFLKLLTEDNEM